LHEASFCGRTEGDGSIITSEHVGEEFAYTTYANAAAISAGRGTADRDKAVYVFAVSTALQVGWHMLQRVSVISTTGLFLGAIIICPNELNTANLDFHMVGVHELWHALAFVALIPRWDASLTSRYLLYGWRCGRNPPRRPWSAAGRLQADARFCIAAQIQSVVQVTVDTVLRCPTRTLQLLASKKGTQ
jgi:hypothetical protein